MKRTVYLGRYTPLKRTPFRRRNKYNAKPVHDLETGDSFDSTEEMRRYRSLQLLQRAGNISELTLHPKVVFVERTHDAPEIAWHPDYSYIEDGRVVCEDSKARPLNDVDRLHFKLWAHYGPCLLRITGENGKLLRDVHGRRG